jgi:hypothetical protein
VFSLSGTYFPTKIKGSQGVNKEKNNNQTLLITGLAGKHTGRRNLVSAAPGWMTVAFLLKRITG